MFTGLAKMSWAPLSNARKAFCRSEFPGNDDHFDQRIPGDCSFFQSPESFRCVTWMRRQSKVKQRDGNLFPTYGIQGAGPVVRGKKRYTRPKAPIAVV